MKILSCNTLVAAVALTLALGFAETPTAFAQDEASFGSGFTRIEKLVRRKKWASARKAVDKLLAENANSWYARARRTEIEGLTRQIHFRLKYPEPSAQSVTQGDLKRFDERSGRFKIVFGADEWRDWGRDGDFYSFPAVFTGPHTITLKGGNLSQAIRFVACSTSEHGVIVDSGHAQHKGGWTPAVLTVISGDDKDRADYKEMPSPALAKAFTFKLKVTKSSVSLSYKGKKVVSGRRPKGDYGYFLIERLNCSSVTVEGTADPSWVQSLVDAADETKRSRFRAKFKVGEVLPKWLYEENSARPAAVSGNAKAKTPVLKNWPGKVDARASRRLGGIARHVFAYDAEGGLEALGDASDLPQPASLWLRAQFERIQGRYEQSLTTLEAVQKADPDFIDAEVMRAGLMLDLHRFDELEKIWFALLDRFPGYGPFHDNAAFDLLDAGRPERAKAVVDRALRQGIATKRQEQLNVFLVRALKGPSWGDIHEIKTRHYVVRSNIDRSICQDAGRVLEQAYLAYKAWLPKVPNETTQKFAVYLFAGEASYQRYAREATGSTAPNSLGLFSPRLKQLLIWNLPDREQMMRTVRHEAFHQYLDRVMPDPARWFNEGHAEYFETAGDAKGGSWKTGVIREDHLGTLKRRGVQPLTHFMALSDQKFMQVAGHSYAQSWSIVYFMHESGPKYAPAARRLFEAFSDGKPQEEAWKIALGRIPFTTFERDYRAWLDPLVAKQP